MRQFDLSYKEFTSNFDLNFDLRSVYESLKQVQIASQVDTIAELEKGTHK